MSNKCDRALRSGEEAGAGLKRVFGVLTARALHGIGHPGADRREDVHDVRTSIKRLRAMFRLVRPLVEKNVFLKENERLRKAAHRLTASREATVGRQALWRLAHGVKPQEDRDAFAAVLSRFGRKVEPIGAAREETAMPGVARALRGSARAFESFQFEREGWEVVKPGYKQIYHQCRSRMRKALDSGEDRDFHRWRIRAKNLLHVLQLLSSDGPKKLDQLIEDLDELQDNLGTSHDFALLGTWLQEDPDKFGGRDKVAPVLERCEKCRTKLRDSAIKTGKKLFGKKAGQFARQLHKRWKKIMAD